MRWMSVFPWVAVAFAAAVTVGPARPQTPPESGGTSVEAPATEEAPAATPADIRVDENKGASLLPSLRDFSSYGASFGIMKFMGGDLGADSRMRPVMQGVFRYHFNENWVGVGEFGFGWNSFKDRGDTVVTFTYGTLGAARHLVTALKSDIRATAGAGMYRWNYKYHGRSLYDQQTWRAYRGFVPGGFVGAEGEHRLTRHVTLTAAAQEHYVFTQASRYASSFDSNHSLFTLRAGVNYHFSPQEGILWERHENRTIRLTSGKEGK
jgi:hypothetical protein